MIFCLPLRYQSAGSLYDMMSARRASVVPSVPVSCLIGLFPADGQSV